MKIPFGMHRAWTEFLNWNAMYEKALPLLREHVGVMEVNPKHKR